MRLVTYDQNDMPRAGLAVGEFIADLEKAAKADGKDKFPADISELLVCGPKFSVGEKLNARLIKFVKRVAAKKEKRPRWLFTPTEVHLCAPILDPQKIICIGQNYYEHVKEQETPDKKMEAPAEPIFFTKFPTALNGPFDPIPLPPAHVTQKVDFEAELALVIGSPLKGASPEEALQAVAGYMVFNDVSARDCQFADKQWCRGKSMDGFAPCGPWIITPTELAANGIDPQKTRVWSTVNGAKMQDGHTSHMIHSIGKLLSHVCQGITLLPGDIVSTGTPAGVGVFRDPPVLLRHGSTVECGVEGIGTISNTCE